uniref:FAST kinase leucine-rich domain-containing protein n=1 Tax=Tetradesmus obliquus TaxID=3088 RepID=A0A383V5C8_TETOB|eukprot:jgi/Sobl393_1/8986/SZX60807.1
MCQVAVPGSGGGSLAGAWLTMQHSSLHTGQPAAATATAAAAKLGSSTGNVQIGSSISSGDSSSNGAGLSRNERSSNSSSGVCHASTTDNSSNSSSSSTGGVGGTTSDKGQVGMAEGLADQLSNCSTEQQLLLLIQQHLSSMDVQQPSAAIKRLSMLRCQQLQPYAACVQRVLQLVPNHTPQDIARVVSALGLAPAAIKQQHQEVLQQRLVPAFLSKLSDAAPRDIGRVLLGAGLSGAALEACAVQQLLEALLGQLEQATPADIARALSNVAVMEQQLPAGQLRQLLNALVDGLEQATSAHIADALVAVAKMGQRVPDHQVRQLLKAMVRLLDAAAVRDVANTVWAVTSMGHHVATHWLQQLLQAVAGRQQQASLFQMNSLLRACAKQMYLPRQLSAAPWTQFEVVATSPAVLTSTAWACDRLGHRDEQLMAALLAEAEKRMLAAKANRSSMSINILNCQDLCNLCWAVAVLDLPQHAQQVLQLAKACTSQWGSIAAEELQQL